MNTRRQLPIRSMHRAEMLLAKQQAEKASGWEFLPDAEVGCFMHSDPDAYDIVQDREQGGYWVRPKQDERPARRVPINNRYERPVTRFGDLMDGLSHITKGLQKIDQASDGDLGASIFSLFQ